MARITVIATGGTRTPSQLDLAERFLRDGHDLRLLASRNAWRFLTSFGVRRPRHVAPYLRYYRPQLLETLAYFSERPGNVPHVNEGKWADAFVLCPATRNSVGKLAAGIGDTYPLQVLGAVPRAKPVIVVPSMNPEMWFDPQFQRNVDALNATEKFRVVCPSRGLMASGDVGFGAQAPLDDIVETTYHALGLVDPSVAAAIEGRPLTPWQRDDDEAAVTAPRTALLVEPEPGVRATLLELLRREYPTLQVAAMGAPAEALAWLDANDADVALVDIDGADGTSGTDVIRRLRAEPVHVHVIACSARDRRAAGAEALARDDVLFLPKPLNASFAIGMIGGCIQGARSRSEALPRRLAAGEVLFAEGDPGDRLFVVQEGRFAIRRGVDGEAVEIDSVGPGELLGEVSFFGNCPRSVTAVAAEPARVVELDGDALRSYLARQPRWLTTVLSTFVASTLEDEAALARLTLDRTD